MSKNIYIFIVILMFCGYGFAEYINPSECTFSRCTPDIKIKSANKPIDISINTSAMTHNTSIQEMDPMFNNQFSLIDDD